MPTYRTLRNPAPGPEVLDDGRPVAGGEYVSAPVAGRTKRLVDSGRLVVVSAPKGVKAADLAPDAAAAFTETDRLNAAETDTTEKEPADG